eukprot:scaffold29707_cov79-Isochrysis_galbana.AAC.1
MSCIHSLLWIHILPSRHTPLPLPPVRPCPFRLRHSLSPTSTCGAAASAGQLSILSHPQRHHNTRTAQARRSCVAHAILPRPKRWPRQAHATVDAQDCLCRWLAGAVARDGG